MAIDPEPVWTQLERELAAGAARGADRLAPYAAGGLKRAVDHLLAPGGTVALVTGFYIADADPPAAETDGPLAAAGIAEWLAALGREAVILTDAPCAPVVEAVWVEAGLDPAALIVTPTRDAAPDGLADALAERGADTLLAVERPGRAADGRSYSMRARDITKHTAAFDGLFHDPRFARLAVGDGGNEIGMGALPDGVIADAVAHGARLAATAPADALVVAGVSHWGAYALAAGAAFRDPVHARSARRIFGDDREHARMTAALNAGAVDGVTRRGAPSIDGVALAEHLTKRDALFRLVL